MLVMCSDLHSLAFHNLNRPWTTMWTMDKVILHSGLWPWALWYIYPLSEHAILPFVISERCIWVNSVLKLHMLWILTWEYSIVGVSGMVCRPALNQVSTHHSLVQSPGGFNFPCQHIQPVRIFIIIHLLIFS